MKKLTLILLFIIILSSCNSYNPIERQSDINRYVTIKKDGCEYLTNIDHWDLTHKGNCTNSIHIYNKAYRIDTIYTNK